MDNRVSGYLNPSLKKRFDDYVSVQEISASAAVKSAVKMMLDNDRLDFKNK